MKSHFLFYLFVCLFSISNCFAQNDQGTFSDIAGLSLENPTGIGGYIGTVGIGLAAQHKTRQSNKPDGNAGIYLGLGDPINYIGIGTSLSIYGLSNNRGTKHNIAESGINLDISKFLFKTFFLKFGVCNLRFWGPNKTAMAAQKSYYGSATTFLTFLNKKPGHLLSYISITAGAGNGFFRKDKDFTPTNSGHFNPFMSIATPIFTKTNAVVEWTGHDISTGISSNIPFLIKLPLSIDIQVTDYLIQQLRWTTSIGYSFNFFKKYKYEKK